MVKKYDVRFFYGFILLIFEKFYFDDCMIIYKEKGTSYIHK